MGEKLCTEKKIIVFGMSTLAWHQAVFNHIRMQIIVYAWLEVKQEDACIYLFMNVTR